MKKFKFISFAVAIIMLFSLTVYADFSDMPQDENIKIAIENAVSNGILSGYEDGTVHAERNITRAEMASIITRVCGATIEGDISEFSDVPEDSWFYSAFAKAYYMGAFAGDGQKHMNPDNNITFQECFTILSQVFYLLPPYNVMSNENGELPTEFPENTLFTPSNMRLYDISVLNDYADSDSIASWAKIFVAGVVSHGGWNGNENGLLTPTSYITRGQFAVVMNNLIQNYIDEPEVYKELPEGSTMIRCNDVILDGTKTDGDVYIADCVAQGGVLTNDITANRLVVRGCATPVDENETLLNDNFGIVISGTFNAIRIIRPYICADVSNADYNHRLYSAPKTSVNLGTFLQE